MIESSATMQAILKRSHKRTFTVDSWRNGELLATGIPATVGTETGQRANNVPERVVFTVPRRDRGVTWTVGGDDGHPLAAKGQRLHVRLGVGLTGGEVEWLDRGVFLVYSSVPQGDTVSVTAVNLMHLVAEARLISPLQPTGTMASLLRSLVEPALTVAIDPLLTDRAVPSTMNLGEDRVREVQNVLDAWAAEAMVDTAGVLQVTPALLAPSAVRTLTDGVGDVVIRAEGTSTREGAFNTLVARGQAPDGGQLQGVAYNLSGDGTSFEGPFNPLPVPDFFWSPLLTTQEECNAAANTVLRRKLRMAAPAFRVFMIPDPTLQLGDVVRLIVAEFNGLCSIEELSMPYHPDGGVMALTCRKVVS